MFIWGGFEKYMGGYIIYNIRGVGNFEIMGGVDLGGVEN